MEVEVEVEVEVDVTNYVLVRSFCVQCVTRLMVCGPNYFLYQLNASGQSYSAATALLKTNRWQIEGNDFALESAIFAPAFGII